MKRKLRIAQYGCGKMSVYTMRIPDVIAAAPGFTTTEEMPANAFRVKNLSFYVE